MNRLSEVRKKRGLSQLRLSYLTGIQPPEISRIETGRLKPYPGWVKRICRVLKCSEREIFPEDENER